MQFDTNADFPSNWIPPATPLSFPTADPLPCARIQTRVFLPLENKTSTVQNVLVKTAPPPSRRQRNNGNNGDDDDSSWSSSSSSSSDDDGSEMATDDATPAAIDDDEDVQDVLDRGTARIMDMQEDAILASSQEEQKEEYAYWMQRTIRDAIYGRVLYGVVLKRPLASVQSQQPPDWQVTTQTCAIKEMSWQHIRRQRSKLAEDPIQEVNAMQYIYQQYNNAKQQQRQSQEESLEQDQQQPLSSSSSLTPGQAMEETNIMMPLDLLSDDEFLYSIMPFCNGGELFERLDLNDRFSETEARYWLRQVLTGLETLQHLGICHRDMSLENLLVHDNGCLIIDMGMCLRVPYYQTGQQQQQRQDLSDSFQQQLSMNGTNVTTKSSKNVRQLILPQGTCGKWIYMSPEIVANESPFDGYAIDMWAAGVILFLMLTGFPPWERACQTDERFRYMTAGYLVQMLTEWDLGLSSDAMDLLQRMLWLDPQDRLSLQQVRAHPWMQQQEEQQQAAVL